jgi:hypothetical protein
MAWVLGAAAHVAMSNGWNAQQFRDVAEYIYGIESRKYFRNAAAMHFRKVRLQEYMGLSKREKKERLKRKAGVHA